MSKKKKRLGRGLDALLGDAIVNTDKTTSNSLQTLPVEQLTRGQYQPRTNMDQDSLNELAESIKAQGIIQPIVVRPISINKYEIIAGERRWRAAQIAQLQDVPVIIRDIPDEATLAVALIENIQRENLNPIEEAVGLRRLMDEFDLTHEEIAGGIGRSRTAVTNLLRLLKLSKGARTLLETGKIEMGHARAILALPDYEQDLAADEVYARGLSVRQTEALIKAKSTSVDKKPAKKQLNTDTLKLQEDLSEKLGAAVKVEDKGGKGRLIINYHSLDELDGILAHIK